MGRGEWDLLNRYRVLVFHNERAMWRDGGDGCQRTWMYSVPLTIPLKMVKMVNCILCVFYHNFSKKKKNGEKGGWGQMAGSAGKTEGAPKVLVVMTNRVEKSHECSLGWKGMFERRWRNVILGTLKKKFP